MRIIQLAKSRGRVEGGAEVKDLSLLFRPKDSSEPGLSSSPQKRGRGGNYKRKQENVEVEEKEKGMQAVMTTANTWQRSTVGSIIAERH